MLRYPLCFHPSCSHATFWQGQQFFLLSWAERHGPPWPQGTRGGHACSAEYSVCSKRAIPSPWLDCFLDLQLEVFFCFIRSSVLFFLFLGGGGGKYWGPGSFRCTPTSDPVSSTSAGAFVLALAEAMISGFEKATCSTVASMTSLKARQNRTAKTTTTFR